MTIEQAAIIHSVLQEPTRIRIANLMLLYQPICGIDIARAFDVSSYHISHHIAMFMQYNICRMQRQGNIIFYSIKDEYYDVMADFMNHVDDIQLDWDEAAFRLVRRYWYRGELP